MKNDKKKQLDITGKRWGMLVAIRQVGYTEPSKNKRREALWLWQCDCGNQKQIPATQVKHQGTRSCGCMLKKHTAELRTADISGKQFGKLTAICPTSERDKKGNIIWEVKCDCGNTVYKSVNQLKSGRVLSCGCLYKSSRTEVVSFRKDFVEGTSISNIVSSKHTPSNNSSGYTGVYFNKRSNRYEAYINFQKKRYFLGSYKDLQQAAMARSEAEKMLHDPIVLKYWDNLTEDKKKEFVKYLQDNKMPDER